MLQPHREGRLLLVDGHGYAYRAFHAIKGLSGPGGSPTNAIYGFIRMLGRIRSEVAHEYIAVAWDGGSDEGRLRLLPEYKAQRPEMPDDLRCQLDAIVEYLEAAGIASFCKDGVEADDWIASTAKRAFENGAEVVIATSDKDFMQLVNERICILSTKGRETEFLGPDEVQEKLGVAPARVVDFLSLAGDSVDNIRGVEGVGPKTAVDLINKYGGVEAIYERINEIQPARLREKLAESKELVERNRQLVSLKQDLDAAWDIDVLKPRECDRPGLAELYRKWGFKRMAEELSGANEQQGVLF
ncbi:MAG: hypothetical protein K9N48_06255 [Verrucomicrobia bacterium]|nr:hypothetical protein [Verrucomicrobiota bacterium]MCF7709282.1 hypothetical protein [Verrucomicrobiota bacterium]